jgi:type IV pilus assembly protein PilZ
MEEKRKNSRASVKVKSEVISSDGFTYSNTVDISKGGIFISTPEPIGIGSPLSLAIQIPGEDPVEITGVVKWVRNNDKEGERAGMGIEFSDMNARQAESLKKLIK